MTQIYLLGSLRNPKVPVLGNELRKRGFIVFDDWYAAGDKADDHWQDYEEGRGRDFGAALRDGRSAAHVFNYDLYNMAASDLIVMLMPCGKSGHLEFGYARGEGRPGFIYFDGGEPDRWDVMYKFATEIAFTLDQLLAHLEPWANYQYPGPGTVQQTFIGEPD